MHCYSLEIKQVTNNHLTIHQPPEKPPRKKTLIYTKQAIDEDFDIVTYNSAFSKKGKKLISFNNLLCFSRMYSNRLVGL